MKSVTKHRNLVALPQGEGKVYLGWRLLAGEEPSPKSVQRSRRPEQTVSYEKATGLGWREEQTQAPRWGVGAGRNVRQSSRPDLVYRERRTGPMGLRAMTTLSK